MNIKQRTTQTHHRSSAARKPCLVPHPRSWNPQEGTCTASMVTLRIHPALLSHGPLEVAAAELGMSLEPDAKIPEYAAAIGSFVPVSAPPHAEGYTLQIHQDGIVLAGADPRGLVWALVTLRQLAEQLSPLPCGEIRDWPEYTIRYHHDDISRHEVSTLADFLRIVRDLSAFKFSHYTLYMEDLFELPGEPQFGCGRGALSADEIRAIIAEGERRQIEVFPTVSLLGHQESMLKLPCYRSLGARVWQPPSSFNPTLPAVRQHVLKILDTLCPLFPSGYFHMCFDETLGVDTESFVEHANWCAEQLVKRGKTPLFWADMLYNHFGIELLDRMHPELIPVVWDYSPRGGRAREALPEIVKRRSTAWVLGGYGTWGGFLHKPLSSLQEQWRNWSRIAGPRYVSGFGSSQWCDGGHNLRDSVWLPAGAFAEHAWSGAAGDPDTVEERFNMVFYGHRLPKLTRIRHLLERELPLDSSQALKLHLLPATGWIRLAESGDLPSVVESSTALQRLTKASRELAACKRQAHSHKEQLASWEVALKRMASVFVRAIAAHEKTQRACRSAVTAVRQARAAFRSAWLAHNRPEGLEYHLATCDEQITGWSELTRKHRIKTDGWYPLDLGSQWNTFFKDVAGIPIGLVEILGVPFRFAGPDKTHAELACDQTLTIKLPEVPIADMHLVATQPRDGETPTPGARLRLWHGDRLVYEEELLNIRHLCDWWAPLGEHMWAGGGMAYVDPLRVHWLLKPNDAYGLTCISRFPWSAAPVADRLQLQGLGKHPLQLFAITLKEAQR
ncbi:MAG: hypothetical protein D6820_10410 [Lentisphaerae bacterium]|nr:MAG: hypothetical protein D6820_10410 [Lentisphaerota bacterium]